MTETKEFIWLTNDLVFKHVFSNKNLIKDFYNSYLKYINSDLTISNIRVTKQKYLQNNNIKLHDYYLDIVIVLSDGELVNIEMYNNFGETECKKSLAYASYIYSHQLRKNNPYKRLKKVTSFNIMNGNYKLSNNEIINKYELINIISHEKILNESIEMLLIRLDILDKISYSKSEERFIRWCRLINAKTREEIMEIAKGDELLMSTVEMVDSFINDPEVISIFHDDSWKIVSAEQRGKTLGLKEGKTLGLKEGKTLGLKEGKTLGLKEGKTLGLKEGKTLGLKEALLKTAKNMLLKNYTSKEISEITNLSISEIEKLKVNQ